MTNRIYHHHLGVHLLTVGDEKVLVDANARMVYVLNDSGAKLWSQLPAGASTGSAASRFLKDLHMRNLVWEQVVETQTPVADISIDRDALPEITAQAPMQVAAGTSDPNPYLCESW